MTTRSGNPFTEFFAGVTVPQVSQTILNDQSSKKAIQVDLYGDGAITAEVIVRGSVCEMLPRRWVYLATITLSDTDTASDGFFLEAPWRYLQAELMSISGTDAAVDVRMGV